jgi:UDP-glucose 4-epimerase
MKVLVTGGAGFIGSHVADAYAERGAEVVVFDNLSSGKRDFVHESARLVVGDVTTEALDELISTEHFDLICHFAAHMELRASVEKPVFDANTNVLGSVRLMDAARRSGVRHIVLASTNAVYGQQVTYPADESHPINPISPYGVSKLAMEQYARYFRAQYGITISTLRYSTVYGPRQNPNGESGVVAIFLQKFLKGAQATVHGDGEQTRDYLHVADVVRATVAAADVALNGEFVVAAGTEVSVNALVQFIQRSLGFPVNVVHGAAKAGDPRRTLGNHAAFTRATGWKPSVPIKEGITSTTQWFVRETQAP